MISGACHCGKVTFQLAKTPEWLTQCNCSYCRRTAGLWAHAPIDDVALTYSPEDIIRYIQGDETLAFVSCKSCGCTTHWESLDPARHQRMAVNVKMANPKTIANIRVRQFDGAQSWTFLD